MKKLNLIFTVSLCSVMIMYLTQCDVHVDERIDYSPNELAFEHDYRLSFEKVDSLHANERWEKYNKEPHKISIQF